MRENSPSLPERSLWDYLIQAALIKAQWAATWEDQCTATINRWDQLHLLQEIQGKNTEVLVQRTYPSSAIMTTINSAITLTTPSPRIKALPRLAVNKRKRRSLLKTKVIPQIQVMSLNMTVTTLMLQKRKRKRLLQENLKRLLRNWNRTSKKRQQSQRNQQQNLQL